MAKVVAIIGLGFGDEGKGGVIDALSAKIPGSVPSLVVKHTGGSQAGHHVVLADGRHHTFAQFGSGTLQGVTTLLSRHMLINPIFLEAEARHLEELGVKDPYSWLFVEREALITTPFHVAANRIREINRTNRHGSCGMGINETVALAEHLPELALRAGGLMFSRATRAKLELIREYLLGELQEAYPVDESNPEWQVLLDENSIDEYVELYRDFAYKVNPVDRNFLQGRIRSQGIILFEGAQGVLLDQNYGFFPHVTRGNTAAENIDDLVEGHPYTKLGLLRTFLTRHGAGPFPTECPESSLLFYDGKVLQRDHNHWGPWQENFRRGYFDLVLAEYAIRMCKGIDVLGLTWTDAFQQPSFVATGYRYRNETPFDRLIRAAGEATPDFLSDCTPVYEVVKSFPQFQNLLVTRLGTPIQLYSHGPTTDDKLWTPSLLGL